MALILPVNPVHPDAEALDQAAEVLRQGRVLAYPTETLYGLGVDPFKEEALERLYRIKGRSSQAPVSLLVRDTLMLRSVVKEISPAAEIIINTFLPGPLTVVLPARDTIPERLTAGTGKIGIRISAYPLISHLFSRFPYPLTTTSVNPSGRPAAKDAKEILAYFREGIDCLLDAGPMPGGVGSTVVDITEDEPVILREGVISSDQIIKALSAPGQG